MYKRNAQGWSKHFDFMLVDEIALQIAFVLAVGLVDKYREIRSNVEKARAAGTEQVEDAAAPAEAASGTAAEAPAQQP